MKPTHRFPQVVLGFALAYAGLGHLTTSRQEFQAQVPSLFKDYADFVLIGRLVALFFVVIFWGNISQYINGIDAFGLNSDRARLIRLFFQPLLVVWALLSTGAWRKQHD